MTDLVLVAFSKENADTEDLANGLLDATRLDELVGALHEEF